MTTKKKPPAARAKKPKKAARVDITKHIELHLVTSGAMTAGWLHTHGMAALGLPELEIRGVPLFLGNEAANLVNHIAQYMYDGKHGIGDAQPVLLGQRFGTGPVQIVKFVKLTPVPGDEQHFDDERWALSDEPLRTVCDDQRHAGNDPTLN